MSPLKALLTVAASAVGLLVSGAAFAQQNMPGAGARPGPPRLTPFLMFNDATPVVKVVMTGELIAALACVAVLSLGLARQGRSDGAARFVRTAIIAAPVAGLFGGAWGLMNSFIGVANSSVSNLAVIAPGLAEAILSVTLGLLTMLLAAIASGVVAPRTATATA